MSDPVIVGTCADHDGTHVKDTYYYDDPEDMCVDFVDIPDFVHTCSDYGNMMGGYNCTCGEPWLDTLGGCSVGGSKVE